MVHTFAWDLLKDPFFIGFNRELQKLNSVHKEAVSQSFPPYNVRKENDDTFILELAVAGYNKNSLSITENDGTLEIKGERPEDAESYLHKGIASRKFTRNFALSEYMYVDSAELKDGMLYVVVKREVPEEKKPKTVKIK